MTGRISLLAVVLGSGAVHGLSDLPDRNVVWMAWGGLGIIMASIIVTSLCWRDEPANMARSAKAEAGERGHRAEQAKVSAALRKVRFSAVPERRRIGLRASWLLPLCAFGVGFAQTSLRAQARLADALQPIHYNQVARVVLRVASLPRLDAERR